MKNVPFVNPVLNGDYPDPAVCRVGEDYYLTVSTGHQYPGLTIYHSRDLVHWEFCCNPLRNFSGDVWAPDLLVHEGKCYLYFCASGSNWVIWSDRMEAGWSEAIDLKVGNIDPGHCVDEEGNRYLFLSGGYLVPLTPDGLSTAGPMEKVMDPAPIPDAWDVEGFFPESPKITKRNGWYYMTYANGGTAGPATSHMVVSARAKHPRGPWEHSPFFPVLRTESREEHWHSRGHGHLVEDPQGEWWILYHAYEKDAMCQGRKLLLEHIVWTEDGWFHTDDRGTSEGSPFSPPGSGETEALCLSDDFSGKDCRLWKAWGDAACTRYQTEGGMLVLPGVGNHPGESMPLTVTCGARRYRAEVRVRVEGGCRAGLTLFYDERFYNGVGFDGNTVRVYQIGRVLAEEPCDAGELFLRMEYREGYVTFFISRDGTSYRKLNFVIDVQPQNHNAYGGFRALRPGVFACGEGKAYFSAFTMTEA